MSLFEVRNPATGEVVGNVTAADSAAVQSAVDEARQAQRAWAAKSLKERSKVLSRFHDMVLDQRDRVMDVIQSESGKARRDAFAEMATVAGTARYYLANADRHLAASSHSAALPGLTSAEVIYKPHGLVGFITPWNYPFLLSIGDAIPALLAGNAVIVKPAELTPLSAVLGGELLQEAGLDKGLFTLVHGTGAIGAELIRHVDYIGFTGGTATGRKVAVAAAERLIPFSLELGGKNPMIVLEGASINDAASGLVAGAFSNAGQTCISIERVYVQASIAEEFTARVVAKAAAMKLGWSHGWDVDMGSMISRAHAAKVSSHVENARAAGAVVRTGGRLRPEIGEAFMEPTVLTNVSSSMAVFAEETFGPVVSIYPVGDADEAIRLANDSAYGLNASVWTGDGAHSQRIARRLETGSAVINSTLLIYNSFAVPMGGVKGSGLGRRHGEHGILRFTQSESIVSSFSIAGGYDSVMTHTDSESRAGLITKALRAFRKLGI